MVMGCNSKKRRQGFQPACNTKGMACPTIQNGGPLRIHHVAFDVGTGKVVRIRCSHSIFTAAPANATRPAAGGWVVHAAAAATSRELEAPRMSQCKFDAVHA